MVLRCVSSSSCPRSHSSQQVLSSVVDIPEAFTYRAEDTTSGKPVANRALRCGEVHDVRGRETRWRGMAFGQDARSGRCDEHPPVPI